MIEKQTDPIVFIIDDDVAVRDSLKILLESHGLQVADFGSTEEFTAHYRPADHACLVLDQHLPNATGLDFLNSIGAIAPGLPVILVTGRGSAATQSRAFQAGAVAYFEKPVADEQLVSAILRSLRQDAAGATKHRT